MIHDSKLYIALLKHYEAEQAEAEAILETYFLNSVGIGEHPNLLAEMKKYVEKLASATDCIEVLKLTYGSK